MVLPDFDTRAKHVFQHLQEGKTKDDWSVLQAFSAMDISEVGNGIGDMQSTSNDALEIPQRMPLPLGTAQDAFQLTNSTPVAPWPQTNPLLIGKVESINSSSLTTQRNMSIVAERGENGRDASIYKPHRIQSRPVSPLSGLRGSLVCGQGNSLRDGNSWGCKRTTQGIINLAKHFRSPIGKICFAPLFEFDDEPIDI
jgi:hypothetical protein